MRFLVLVLMLTAGCGSGARKGTVVATGERDSILKTDEGAVGGVVRDAADGLALSMVSVLAERDGKIIAHDVSDHAGHYRLGPLGPGPYRVSARFARARVVYEGVVVHEALETELKISIDLRDHGDSESKSLGEGSYGIIEGVVVDAVDGKFFPGSVVSLSGKTLEDALLSIADGEGRFRFRNLRPGVYSLSCYYHLVEKGNIEIRRGNIVVAPGETTAVQLKMDLRVH